jgi:hypothetical protein
MGCGAMHEPVRDEFSSALPVLATPADATAAALGLSARVDPAQGLVVVARLEDASDGEAPPRIASGHRCAPPDIDQVAALFRDYLDQRRGMDVPVEWACTGARCELRGMMEFDPTRALRFGRDAAGGVVVIGVDLYGDAAASEEHAAEVRRQVEAEHQALRGRCP